MPGDKLASGALSKDTAHRRHDRRMRDAGVVDRLPKARGGKLVPQEQGGAGRHGAADRIEQGVDVIERQHAKHASFRLQADAAHVNFSGQNVVSLAVQHTLGKSCSAGRIDDHAGRIRRERPGRQRLCRFDFEDRRNISRFFVGHYEPGRGGQARAGSLRRRQRQS